MKGMLHVIDCALEEADRATIFDYFMGFGRSTEFAWADGCLDLLLGYGSPLSNILRVVNKHVDLGGMVGCEYWSHLNTKSGWHKDTDEVKLYRDSVESFPMCSIVYYPHIQNVKGGKLIFETLSIQPVTNRLVIFAPDLRHCVEDFSGERVSVAINPWDYKLEGYL
jgi:hypothetical protein